MDSICRVAASNFSDAIDSGRLRVDVEDDCADEAVTVGRDDFRREEDDPTPMDSIIEVGSSAMG